jgi:cellulose synthase/poly-beta-1,6-N-acetylglucosamine synthase-like glycosyltransferase
MPEHFEQPTAPLKPTFSVLDVSAADTMSLADPHVREQVQRYANWLAKQAENETHQSPEEVNNYVREATTLVKVGEHEVAPFAPFRPELSALRTFTTPQILTCCTLAVLWLVAVLVFQLEALTVVISAITVIYTACLLLALLIAFKSFHSTSEEHIDDEIVHLLKQANWPIYTVLCPLYREAQVVPQFVEAMQALDYPPEKLQILFLTEENDSQTRTAIRALSLPSNFQILKVPDGVPRTKPRACNYGLLHALGTYTVIYDAEDIPDPLQLKKAVLAFANADLQTVCVQAKLNFYNSTQNLLTRWFTAEYSMWFDFVLPGLQATNFALPLGGTSNHFRTASLRALGGWDAYNVTEDCDLGLRIKRFQMKTVILDSTTLEEANPQLKNWLRQRSRWIKGYMQTYLVHMRTPFKAISEGNLYNFFSFQFVIGSRTGMLFFNLLMWLLLAFYLILRAKAIPVYHVLFPGPTLYLGAFCLIFGNLFYLYLHLLACAKRGDYHLVFWSLFIPIYWLLMSIAGIYAFIELLVKPHYWQKTVHGLHFKRGRQEQTAQEAAAFVRQQTQSLSPLRAVPRKNPDEVLRTITSMLKAIVTLPLPVVSSQQKQAVQTSKKTKVRDLWLLASFILSCIMSVAACLYYFQQHKILLYDDAYSHLRIARAVFDSTTPGLAQLGSVWLPLPHILMWPFIWNDYLWHSGLAGSFVGMICYILTAIYLFLSIRRLTHSSRISFLGSLLFIFNPNVLYLQSTPLSELTCFGTLTIACYYFLAWTQEDTTKYLVLAAMSTFLATLARYDGWVLFLCLSCLIFLIGWMKRQRLLKIGANLVIFGTLGGLGILLWFIWNQIIFGDALYFQNGQYSSQAAQMALLHSGGLYTYHNVWLSVKTYTLDVMYSFGNVLAIVAAFAFVVFFIRRRFSPTMLAALAFVSPFAFYILSLYSGQAAIWVPGAVPATAHIQFYNVRYGAEMVVPASLFIATLLHRISFWLRPRLNLLSQIAFVILLVAQTMFTTSSGIISIQDGQYGLNCVSTHIANAYLAQHYAEGRILQDVTSGDFSLSDAGFDFKNVVYFGSGALWREALADPADTVQWILSSPGDTISKYINLNDPLFLSHFSLVVQEPTGLRLYHRKGEPPLPTRPLPAGILTEHRMCPVGNH